ncbi:hypothetical protein [Armatimonas rosea]|uniref:Uncharacterized protein n=1 Tax=Armatimonas rosea TaxID=685828 RepID=A0A7W9W7E3_ARMRO|nr:hypothetical protein [Armatimonas rosea]MBB6051558.1 hypothetical protein [Armatimonas rosea]
MSLLTLEVSDEILTLTATPEGMARAQAAVLAAFGITPVNTESHLVSDTLYDSFLDIIDGVEAGTIKTKPHDSKAAMARAEVLLCQISGQ